jgi:hypothetical protein
VIRQRHHRISRAIAPTVCLLPICLLALLVTPATPRTQKKWNTGEFTHTWPEHVTTTLEEPITVRAVAGTITVENGHGEPIADAFFDVRGPEDNKTVREGTTDRDGYFSIKNVPRGTYQFKATCYGFDVIVGTLVVTKAAPKAARIKIELPVGT